MGSERIGEVFSVGGKGDRFRNGRGVISALLGVVLTNAFMWGGGSPGWYYSFFVDALVFAIAVGIFRVWTQKKGRESSEKSFKEAALWVLGVILGALLAIGVNALQLGVTLEGTDLIWSVVLFVAIAGAAYGVIILQRALKPTSSPM